jgi:hypothetical protein
MFIVDCYKKGEILEGIEEALSFLQFVIVPTEQELKPSIGFIR